MSNVLGANYKTTSVVNPTPTIDHSVPNQTPNVPNHTRNISQLYMDNKEGLDDVYSVPVRNPLAAAREPTQFIYTSRIQGDRESLELSQIPAHSDGRFIGEESPEVLFTISRFRGKIIVESTAAEPKDARVIITRFNGQLSVSDPNVFVDRSQSKSSGTAVYRFLCAFLRALFYPTAFIMVLNFPDVYPVVLHWLQEQTDMFAFFGTIIQNVASSQLAGAVLQYTVFCLIVTL
ncbi:hypothetical protein K435DRAFT_855234 [Dendrothele bispora CBS 962.96]|uniref:Uncharacterized protein n=1 Tax=Dendrothele bispora (strain CBS 962.96) TaxID=1314807 RepID=A0A4S8MC51_DENBC|nr:hypothetical protein K435DRAFT_855234 [Dendrothele bispora CBS 962.96]